MKRINNNLEGLKVNIMSVQNELSNILGFSLRIMDKNALSNVLKYLEENGCNPNQKMQITKTEEEILKYKNELIEKPEDFKFKSNLPFSDPINVGLIWRTNVSYSNFFLRSLKTDPILNAHSQIVCLQRAKESSAMPDEIRFYPCPMGTEMKEFVFPISNYENNVLFGGQLFFTTNNNNLYIDKCIEHLLEFSLFHSKTDRENGITKHDALRLKELISKIPIVKEENFVYEAKRVKFILNSLFRVAIEYNKFILSREEWVFLTQTLTWLCSRQMGKITQKLIGYFKDNSLFRSFGHIKINIIFIVFEKAGIEIKIPFHNESSWDLNEVDNFLPVIQKKDKGKLPGQTNSKLVYIELEHTVNKDTDPVSEILNYNFINFLEWNTESKKRKYLEYLLSIGEELNTGSVELKYPLISGRYNPITKDPVQKIVEIVLKRATKLVMGNLGFFAFVDYTCEKLKYFSHYVTDIIFEWNDKYETEINSLRLFGKDENSLLIESIHRKKAILVDDTEDSEFRGVFLEKHLKSALVVPILFHETIIGVINISGSYASQFDSEQLRLIEDFSKTIAPYIHQALLLKSIEKIQEIALDNIRYKSEKDKLIAMSKVICDLFFVSASSIWFPKEGTNKEKFVLKGSYGISSKKHLEAELSLNNSVIGEAIKSENVFAIPDIIDDSDKNIKKLVIKKILSDEDIRSLMIYPHFIVDQDIAKGREEKHPMCTVHIYRRKHNQNYSAQTIRMFCMIGKVVGAAISSFKMLNREVRQRENLSLFAAHELRSPINSMKSIAEQIKKGPEKCSPIRWRFLLHDFDKRAILAQERLEHLVSMVKVDSAKEFLFDSKDEVISIARESVENDKKEVKINEILNQIRFSRKTKNKKINMYSCDRPCYFYGSNDLLTKIFENVIENSIKYSEDHAEIDIIYSEGEYNYYWNIRNVGIGIPREEVIDIFKHKIRGSNVGNSEGSGIGLYYAREFARMYGGSIKLTKNEPIKRKMVKGSTNKLFKTEFQIFLPKT